jgi:1,4-dihydroxy-2-naphthoyl-CoA hydrolase
VPRPTFDDYDEKMAETLVKAHEAAGPNHSINGWLAIRLQEVWPGGVRAVMAVRDDLLTPVGNLHGGVMAAFCDHVLGVVCYPVMPPGSWAATTEFKLNYLAPVRGGDLIGVATIISLSKRTAVVRLDVENEGRAVCVAQGTILVMPPKNQAPGQ